MMPLPPFGKLCLYALFGVCPLLFFTDLTRNPYFTQIVLLNLFICWIWLSTLVQAWRAGEWTWVRSPLDPYLWALLALCLVTIVSSYVQHPHVRASILSESTRAYLFLVVNSYLVYAAAVRFQDRDRLKRLIWISYAVSFAASVYGIAQYYGTEWFWPQSLNPYGSRPVSTFGNPNFMSSYLVMILPVACADYVFKFSGLARTPLFVVIMASMGALLATLTRSSWAGGVVALLVAAGCLYAARDQWPKWRKPALILAAALVVITLGWPKSRSAAYSETVFGRLAEVKRAATGTYGAVTQRLLIWLCSWQMVEDHPVIGKGWGAFELFFPYYQGAQLRDPTYANYRTHANNSHNEVLEYWAQIGTAGLGLMVAIWLLFFRMGFSIARRTPVPLKGLQWGLLGGVAGMLVDNLLNVSAHFAVPGFIFWWWVGSAFVLDPEATEQRRYPLDRWWRRALAVGAALFLIGVMTRNVLLWAEEVNFFKGFKYSKGGVDLLRARDYLEKAFGYFSRDVNNNYELANVYARLGQGEKALAMYDQALAANAGYDEIYFNRATMLMQLGREEEAIRSYRMAIAINPMSREGYNALAGIYLRDIPRYGEAAAQMYRQAVQAFPDDKDLWNNLGYLAVQRQQWDEAHAAYKRALEIDPHFELARRNLAIVEETIRRGASAGTKNASTGNALKQ